jgi:hypothetical protein
LYLGSDLLLDLVLGQSLELGASTDKVSTEVDVGDGTLSVEGLEVGLDGIWIVSGYRRLLMFRQTYLRCRACRAYMVSESTWSRHDVEIDAKHVAVTVHDAWEGRGI